MSRNYRYEDKQDDRNYDLEAKNLIRDLHGNDLYNMYEIVSNQLKRANSATRDKELNAVKNAIEKRQGIDQFRLKRIWDGYKSDMARTANPKDGNARVVKKKA
jgi:hypothetical protein